MQKKIYYLFIIAVAPLAGAWIEMSRNIDSAVSYSVAPLAGAWIEILARLLSSFSCIVAPLAGAWIEMLYLSANYTNSLPSLLSQERGLKFPAVCKLETVT